MIVTILPYVVIFFIIFFVYFAYTDDKDEKIYEHTIGIKSIKEKLVEKKLDLLMKISKINDLKPIKINGNYDHNILVYNNENSTIFLKSQKNNAILEELAYDISQVIGLDVVPTTVVCNTKDLLFDSKLIVKINALIIGYSKNIVIQGVNINSIDESKNEEKCIEYSHYKKVKELDMISAQKALLFNIIIGRKISHKVDSIVDIKNNIYEIDNYDIGNKNTNTWLFGLEQLENLEIDQKIKNDIIFSEKKLRFILDEYKFKHKYNIDIINIKNNYKKLKEILISKKTVKIKDLLDFYYIKELCMDKSRLDNYY